MPVNVVSQLPTESNLFTDPGDASEGTWHDFKTLVTYERDDGLMQIPVAGPDGTPAMFVRTHAASMRKVVRWSGMKYGKVPEAPSPEAVGDNDVFLAFSLSPAVPQLLPNGQAHAWAMSGVYYYGLRRPFCPTQAGVPTGGHPADHTPASANVYPASMFRRDLLAGTDPGNCY